MKKPAVFVIGDSISCYYGKHLQKMLEGVFDYDRKGGRHTLRNLDDGTNGVNGGDSSMVLTYVQGLKKRGNFKPDYLILNCGIHDTKKNPATRKNQIPPEAYKRNLQTICRLLRKMGIKVIWVRTTPFNKNFVFPKGANPIHTTQDTHRYNRIADGVMKEYRIPTVDLYAFTINLGEGIYCDNYVHFDEATAARQASFIAGYLDALIRNGHY